MKLNDDLYKYNPSFNYFDSTNNVRYSTTYYKYTSHKCLLTDNISLSLKFENDVLYRIILDLSYSKDDYQNCMKDYDLLTLIFKKKFPYFDSFETKSDGEESGYGSWFYLTQKDQKEWDKLNQLSIGFKINYEKKQIDGTYQWASTGNVDNYEIGIDYTNLKGTKLRGNSYAR